MTDFAGAEAPISWFSDPNSQALAQQIAAEYPDALPHINQLSVNPLLVTDPTLAYAGLLRIRELM